MKFNDTVLKELETITSRYPKKEAALLPALYLLEREFGTISNEGMEYVASLLDISPAKVFGVFTFYTYYRRPGTGKYLIQLCSTLPCALRKSEFLFDHISKKLGIKNGETTPDKMFTLKKVECLGACDRAPFLQINEDDFEHMTPEKVNFLLDELRKKQ